MNWGRRSKSLWDTLYLPQLRIEELWYNIPYLCERCYTQHALNILGKKDKKQDMHIKTIFVCIFNAVISCIFLSYREKMVSLHRIIRSNFWVSQSDLVLQPQITGPYWLVTSGFWLLKQSIVTVTKGKENKSLRKRVLMPKCCLDKQCDLEPEGYFGG